MSYRNTKEENLEVLRQYIRGLSDEQRDRILEAQHWAFGTFLDDDGVGRCLVGHAKDVNMENFSVVVNTPDEQATNAWQAYDALWCGQGMPQAELIAFIKSVAAEGNSITVPPSATPTAALEPAYG